MIKNTHVNEKNYTYDFSYLYLVIFNINFIF